MLRSKLVCALLQAAVPDGLGLYALDYALLAGAEPTVLNVLIDSCHGSPALKMKRSISCSPLLHLALLGARPCAGVISRLVGILMSDDSNCQAVTDRHARLSPMALALAIGSAPDVVRAPLGSKAHREYRVFIAHTRAHTHTHTHTHTHAHAHTHTHTHTL